MIHSFETRVAVEVGLNSAVILNNLYYWVEKNRANGKNFYDGYYWTYNSRSAFVALFPYFTERQIQHAIQKLIEKQLVITGNFNEDKRDRTLWYAITPKGYALITGQPLEIPVISISQKCEMEKTEMLNEENKNVKCIISSSNNKTTNRKLSKKEKHSFDEIIDAYTENEELRAELKEHLKTRKAKKATLTDHAIELSLKELDKHGKNDAEKILIVQTAIMSGWTTFYPLKEKQAFKSTNSSRSRRRSSVGDDFDASYDLDAYEANYMYI